MENETAATPTITMERIGDVAVGKPMPSFGGWTIDNTLFSSKRIFSKKTPPKAVLVSYFASWCAPCKKGLPVLHAVAEDSQIELILVALESDERKVKSFLKELQIDPLTIMDKHRKIAERHGVVQGGKTASIPKTFLVDSNLIVRKIYKIEGDDFKQVLVADINAIAK